MGGKHGKKLEEKREEQVEITEEDEEVLKIKQNGSFISMNIQQDNQKRVDIQPPEGADGCVMFIEKRDTNQSP